MADRLQAELAQTRLVTATEGTYGNGRSDSPQRPFLGLVDSPIVRLRVDDFPRGFFLAMSPQLKFQTGNKRTNYRSPF